MWDLAEKKVVRSRDIAFMEEKTIADWKLEKKGIFSESIDKDRLDDAGC